MKFNLLYEEPKIKSIYRSNLKPNDLYGNRKYK